MNEAGSDAACKLGDGSADGSVGDPSGEADNLAGCPSGILDIRRADLVEGISMIGRNDARLLGGGLGWDGEGISIGEEAGDLWGVSTRSMSRPSLSTEASVDRSLD